MAKKTFDPRSETVVLEYRGTEATDESPGWTPHLLGIPSRDLTEADISRLVYQQAINEYDGTPDGPPMPDPEKPSQAKGRALVELLLSRKVDGKAVYGLAKASARKDDEPDEGTSDSDAPAETPAQPEV